MGFREKLSSRDNQTKHLASSLVLVGRASSRDKLAGRIGSSYFRAEELVQDRKGILRDIAQPELVLVCGKPYCVLGTHDGFLFGVSVGIEVMSNEEEQVRGVKVKVAP